MRRATLAAVATMALVIAACGGDAASTTTTSPSSTTSTLLEPTTTMASPATTSTTTAPSSTTSLSSTTTTAQPTTTTTVFPGTPIDFGPAEGDVLMVIGVRHDDVLNVRAAPGADQPVRAEIPPTFDELVALGNTREVPRAFWIEVDYEGTDGWVHLSYIGYEGDTTDETSTVIDELGERPVESSMTDLGELVASVYASPEDPESDIVQVTPVSTGDLAEVTYDVVGLGDDSVRGVRVHIFAEEVDGGFSLRSVEMTLICGRGVDDGACV